MERTFPIVSKLLCATTVCVSERKALVLVALPENINSVASQH